MADELIYLFQDAVDSLTDQVGVKANEVARKIRRAILGAYQDEMPQHFKRQRHFLQHHRIMLVAPVSTGTVTYNHDLKELTFSSTPPDWVQYGRIKVGDRICDVKSYPGFGNTVVLDDALNPGEDLTTATAYELRRYEYALPGRFRAVVGRLQEESRVCHRRFRDLPEALEWERLWESSSAWSWSLARDPDRQGGHMVKLNGHPTSAESLDLMIHQTPRKLRYSGYESMFNAGTTVTVSGREITSSAAIFTPDMVGSFLRVGTASKLPEGEFGVSDPYAAQGQLAAFESTQQMLLAEEFDADYTAVKFRVSDPIDLPALGGVYDAFWRCCEWKYAIADRNSDAKEGTAWTAFREALKRALGECVQYEEPVDEDRWPDAYYGDAWPSGTLINGGWSWF